MSKEKTKLTPEQRAELLQGLKARFEKHSKRHKDLLFCDRRNDYVFVYHNGADSRYGARGFRGSLRV